MSRLKILIYGDIDINIIDGSSIWVTSIINTLAENENIDIDYLLKTPIKTDNVIKSINKDINLNIINPFEHTKFRGTRMQVDEAADAIEKLDHKNNYDCIISRGNLLCEQLCKKENIRQKIMSYIITQYNSKNVENIKTEDKIRLKFIFDNSRYMFLQTEESKNLVKKILQISTDEKFIILPPMIPNLSENLPEFINKKNRLIYSGKFSENWYTYNILKSCENLINSDSSISLTVVGNKFNSDINNKKEEILSILQNNSNINWLKGVSRQDSNKAMESCDIGIAWRSILMDNNYSVELSTKVLEYARAGIPIILRKTSMYENLLGKDYPLFVEDGEIDFLDKIKLALYNEDIYLKAATMAYNSVKKYTFSEVYKSIHLKIWSFKKDKTNLVFAGHDFKFINKIIEYFKLSDKFEVKIDEWKSHNKHDEAYSKECLGWADIIFCEWGLGNAVWYSKNKKNYQKLIVRIHSQERRAKFYKEFNIEKIDKVICITPYMFEEVYRLINIPRYKIEMIFNYVDCDEFNKDKLKGSEYNLGMIGICPKSKRLDLSIDIFEKLWEKDNRYKLYIKGKHPKEYYWIYNNESEKLYYNNVFERIENSEWKDNVVFDEFGRNVDEWFTKIGYILSPSDFEGSHVSVAEGIASGCVPIIFNWNGSETIYEDKFICSCVDEAVNLIKTYRFMIGSEELKQYCKVKFDIYKIIDNIEMMMLI